MPADQRQKWMGYAPPTIKIHKYAVRYHPKLGRRVACKLNDRNTGWELTLFSPDPQTEIESMIPDGGPFFVNEWKQVLKPVLGEEGYRDVLYLGEFPDLHFRFRFRGRTVDNALIEGLKPGDHWEHQEVGMIYKYDCGRGAITRDITMWEDFAAVRETETVNHPPSKLLDAFVAARPARRSGRFYVNEHGIVFLPAVEDVDAAVFVGRIDPEKDAWFPKHEPNAS